MQVNATQFVYDHGSDRLKKSTGASVSRYPLGDDYEITNGVTTKYFSLPGMGVLAKRVTGAGPSIPCQPEFALDGFYWLHQDRLGSIQAITASQGCEIKRSTYRAYGENISESGTHVESRGWIEQRADDETGLTYLHARYYDPAIGVFVSPDVVHPALPGAGTNRFSYGLGDPVGRTDRSGLYVCGENGDQLCEEVTVEGGGGFNGDQCDPLQHLGCDYYSDDWWYGDDCQRFGDCPLENDNNQNSDTGSTPGNPGTDQTPTAPTNPVVPSTDDPPGTEPPGPKKPQRRPGENRFHHAVRSAVCRAFAGYVDFNFTGIIPMAGIFGAGPTFGAAVNHTGVHLYGGVAAGTAGASLAITRSGSSPSPGLNVAGGGVAPAGVGVAGQFGYGAIGRSGSTFGEVGLGFGTPGVSGSAYWVSRNVNTGQQMRCE